MAGYFDRNCINLCATKPCLPACPNSLMMQASKQIANGKTSTAGNQWFVKVHVNIKWLIICSKIYSKVLLHRITMVQLDCWNWNILHRQVDTKEYISIEKLRIWHLLGSKWDWIMPQVWPWMTHQLKDSLWGENT